MSEAPEPKRKKKKTSQPQKDEETRPLRINTTVRVLGPKAPGAKALYERQVEAMGRILRRYALEELKKQKGDSANQESGDRKNDRHSKSRGRSGKSKPQ